MIGAERSSRNKCVKEFNENVLLEQNKDNKQNENEDKKIIYESRAVLDIEVKS